ncbi:energy-coupling factor ABC transporter ATP-binding protein [Corynebacterium freiburgense]|uniref:energy-coupling factor ABC transporter ATP-binding protein n=1 Tax=Corynebacterium freiburgense TaxID=556548 RepID=UPI0004265A6E|nr:ABC transporter ATP-binding protein [Corynebacterium freiburgense]WJZ03364.1 Cobalt import ATP-binding protein CbiO [Corynebacterium freiburgense]
MDTKQPIVQLCDVHFAHDDSPPIFEGVSLEISPGDRIVLLGPNGAGKSTLFRLLCGSWEPTQGNVIIRGRSLRGKKKDKNFARSIVQLVLQEPDDQIFALSVRDDVSFGPLNQGLSAVDVSKRVEEAMQAAEIADLAERVPQQLSYGQRKRVALAGALAMKPEVLMLDEPTAGLDPAGCRQLLRTLSQIDAAVVLSTHDVNLAYAFAAKAIIIHKKQLITGPIEEIMCNQKLLKAVRLELPWSPYVSAALGRTIRTPEELIGLEDLE